MVGDWQEALSKFLDKYILHFVKVIVASNQQEAVFFGNGRDPDVIFRYRPALGTLELHRNKLRPPLHQ
jgi:hypothetical protein